MVYIIQFRAGGYFHPNAYRTHRRCGFAFQAAQFDTVTDAAATAAHDGVNEPYDVVPYEPEPDDA